MNAEHYAALARTPLKLEPVTLTGRYLRLEPLALEHAAALAAAGDDPAVWAWYTHSGQGLERTRRWVQEAVEGQAAGRFLPFVQRDLASGRIVGSTRYMAIDGPNRRVEIGWTWLAPAFQRTAANTESKYLLLRHAFETLGLIRVEFKTDSLNQASRRALAGIGATEEGLFRNHMIAETGRLRHSVYFSVTDSDWPAVKAGLERKLA